MQLLGDKMADTVQGAADSSGYNSSGEEESEDSEGTSLELYGGWEHGYNVSVNSLCMWH